MNIKPITLQDAEESYESVKDNGNPSQGDTTYHKELYRFDDGKALFFCAGTLYDGDDFDHYCRLGIENPNAVLADFEFDYVMPWNPDNEYGDVFDTEISLPITQSDVEWLNKEANDIVKGYESGELVASSRKTGKKKPVKSSEDKEKYWGAFGENGCVDFLTRKEFIDRFGEEPKDEDALDYVDSGCHGKTKKKPKKPVKSSMPGKEKGIQAIMDEYGCTREEAIEIMNEDIQSSRKPVKSSYNPWNGEGSIRVSLELVEDGEHSSPDFSSTVMDLDDFIAECKSYAESCNGSYFVNENDSNSYKIEFMTGDDSMSDNPGADPYYEESCGIVIAELIYPYNNDMADYIQG